VQVTAEGWFGVLEAHAGSITGMRTILRIEAGTIVRTVSNQ